MVEHIIDLKAGDPTAMPAPAYVPRSGVGGSDGPGTYRAATGAVYDQTLKGSASSANAPATAGTCAPAAQPPPTTQPAQPPPTTVPPQPTTIAAPAQQTSAIATVPHVPRVAPPRWGTATAGAGAASSGTQVPGVSPADTQSSPTSMPGTEEIVAPRLQCIAWPMKECYGNVWEAPLLNAQQEWYGATPPVLINGRAYWWHPLGHRWCYQTDMKIWIPFPKTCYDAPADAGHAAEDGDAIAQAVCGADSESFLGKLHVARPVVLFQEPRTAATPPVCQGNADRRATMYWWHPVCKQWAWFDEQSKDWFAVPEQTKHSI